MVNLIRSVQYLLLVLVAVFDTAELAGTVTFGLPGAAQTFSLEDVRALLAQYGAISAEQLRD